MQSSSSDRDFAAYNAAQAARPVRPLARAAAALVLDGDRGPVGNGQPVAVELGSGAGIEARFLAESGFRVHSVDSDRSTAATMAQHAAYLPIAHRTLALEDLVVVPATDLLLSCATLAFVRRDAFMTLWQRMRSALRPAGVLAVDFFGDRDDWAGTDGTYLTREELDALLDGLDVLELREDERDGRSFGGPKHWHTFQVLARRP